MNPRAPATVRFGDFEFDQRTLELRRGDENVHLPPKPSVALGLLVANAGTLVTREELQKAVWPETVIEFDQGLNTCMRHLRSTLGDDAEAPSYIETVPRRGYRFIAAVESVPTKPHPGARWPGWAAAVAAAGLAAWALTTFVDEPEPAPAPLLAVLPFEPIGGTADDSAFADGLTEELLTSLAASDPERLRVLARTSSYRLAQGFTLTNLNDRFGIDLVIQGRVRREPGGYKVTAQLVDARTATTRWSAEHRLGADAMPVAAQEDLSARVATALGGIVGFDPAAPQDPRPAGATETSWRVARHLVQGRRTGERERALALLEEVLAADPTFAPGHEARARVLLDLGRDDEAEAAIDEALATVGTSAGLLLERGRLRLRRWRMDEAGRDLAMAVEMAPQSARAHQSHGYYLGVVGRHEESLAAMSRARALDPVSESVVGDAGFFAHWARKPRLAIERCESIRPYALPAYRLMVTRCLLHNYAQVGDWSRALREARAVMEAAGASEAERSDVLGASGPREGVARYFRWAADPARLRFTQGGESAYHRAIAASGAGDVEAALTALEEAFARREPRLIEIGVEPRLDPLRGHPRFMALAAEIGVGTVRGERAPGNR